MQVAACDSEDRKRDVPSQEELVESLPEGVHGSREEYRHRYTRHSAPDPVRELAFARMRSIEYVNPQVDD